MTKTEKAIVDNLEVILYAWRVEQISPRLFLFTKGEMYSGGKVYVANINNRFITIHYKEGDTTVAEFECHDKNALKSFMTFQKSYIDGVDQSRLDVFLNRLKG